MKSYRILSVAAMLLLASAFAFAQVGSVTGTVFLATDDGNIPAVGARVELDGHGGGHHGEDIEAFTDETGAFAFNEVPAGMYSIETGFPLFFPEMDMIEVLDGQTTTVDFLLEAMATGAVAGTVSIADSLGNIPAVGARVSLEGHGGHGGDPGGPGGPGDPEMELETITDETGAFSFDAVPVGPYTIVAMLPMEGHASEVIEVLEDLTTNVELILEPMGDDTGHHGGGHGEHHGDSLTTVELSGVAMVVVEENPAHTRTFYFLDVDADDVADYRLNFGPPWYEPGNGNVRPADGDEITVVGGLMGYAEPWMVVVWELNGLFWREPGHGHGGHGGGWHHDHNCDVEPVGIELFGIAQVISRPDAPHGDFVMYLIDTDDDMMPNYMLDFGAPDYDPGNGATRPVDGEEITIVGGWLDCPNTEIDPVIVYEINGLFWRAPGDTVGLGQVPLEVSDYTPVISAASYLTAVNYPNPFNPETRIEFSTPLSGLAKVTVYDITGREVATLLNSSLTAGSYSVSWNGASVPSGIYFYRVSVGSQSLTQRMLLLK